MKNIILNCVPPFSVGIPSPPLSILKAWLKVYNYNSSIVYWNLHLHSLQRDFIWNKPTPLGTASELMLYLSYIANKKKDRILYENLKQILQSTNPSFLTTNPAYYEDHMQSFIQRLDKKIDAILLKFNFSEALFCGFSIKMDGWIVASIIAEKIKEQYPNMPIVIGGINVGRTAKAFLDNFIQFDIAMWGEGETSLVKLTQKIESGKVDYDDVPNIVYRKEKKICISNAKKHELINLSEPLLFPDYDDFFIQKSNVSGAVVLPIEGSRGCHWNKCKFCYLNADYKYRFKSADKICSEIKYMMDKYGIYVFEFLDNDFIGINMEHTNQLLDQLIKIKKEEPRFIINTVEVVTKGLPQEVIKKMFAAGIIYVQIGYESPSGKLLNKINKKNTFASNLLYLILSMEYNIPLYNVNTLISMPEETAEDIIEATNNLRYLRFLIHPINFRHFLVPVQVNSISRYYMSAKAESTTWVLSSPLYKYLQKYIKEDSYWDIFTFIRPVKHHQWDVFRKVESYYIENRHTYKVNKIDSIYYYYEFINEREVLRLELKENSIEVEILLYANKQIISLEQIKEKLYITDDQIVESANWLYNKGLIYKTSDYSEILAIIDLNA